MYNRGDRPMGGLLGSGSNIGLNKTSSTLLDFENPAMKQALNDLLSSQPRDNSAGRGYGSFHR